MLNLQPSLSPSKKKNRYDISVARTSYEVEEAQRLRYQVFFEEMGASSTNAIQNERDIDQYDADCDHLLVRDVDSGFVVGSYRIMRPDVARRRGEFYSDSEFDLSRLANIRGTTCRSRSRLHPPIVSIWFGDHVVMSGLARYMIENNYEFVIGCASIPLADGHENAIAVYHEVAKHHLAPAEYRVFPKHPYPVADASTQSNLVSLRPPRIPALIKGYTRLGAWIGGAPAWDPDFNTADLFILLPIARMSGAYAKHFLGESQAA